MKLEAALLVVVLAELSSACADGVSASTALSNLPTPQSLNQRSRLKSVSQYGITWTFEEAAPVGQFVNGDFYVVGPITIAKIDPKPLWGDEVGPIIDKDQVRESKYPGKQARNGAVLNPTAKNGEGGYDSRLPSGRYDPKLFAHLPIRMAPGDTLVSTVSRRNEEITKFGGQHVKPLRVAAVLTCVGEALPADAFRPSYCDTIHSRPHRASELRRELLLRLPQPRTAPGSLTAYIAAFQKPWLDTVDFGFAAPVENLPNYGQEIAEVVGEASLLLMMDYPKEEKEHLLVNLVQVGIDLWGVARAGGSWPAHGGLYSGRKWPIIFAGVMLSDTAMQSPTDGQPQLHFAEDDQTALCPYTYRGKVFESGWTGAKAIFTGHSLAGSGGDRGKWELGWGPVDLFPPAEWPLRQRGDLPGSEAYRRANTSAAWVGEALSARLIHLEKVWNHDAFFAYVDRWMTEDDKPFLPAIRDAGFQDLTKIPDGRFERQGFVWGPRFVKEMWNTCRNHLPPAADGHQDLPAERTWK